MREIKCQITHTSEYETVIKRMNTNNQKNRIKISYLVITVSFPIRKNLACLKRNRNKSDLNIPYDKCCPFFTI